MTRFDVKTNGTSIVSVKTDHKTLLDHLLVKHGATVERHADYIDDPYSLRCPALPGVLVFPERDMFAALDPYWLVISRFIAALEAEGIEP